MPTPFCSTGLTPVLTAGAVERYIDVSIDVSISRVGLSACLFCLWTHTFHAKLN